MSEMKPCPFCGSKAITTTFIDPDDFEYMPIEVNDCDAEVTCENERCINGWYLSPKAWNNRPIEDALQARIAELEAENAMLKQLPQPIEFWSDEKKELYRRNESRTIKSGREEERWRRAKKARGEEEMSEHNHVIKFDVKTYPCKCGLEFSQEFAETLVEAALSGSLPTVQLGIDLEFEKRKVAELEAEVTKCHELQDSYCDRIAELEVAQRWIPVSEPPKECEMRVFKDGDAWCFVLPDFQDLQASPSVWMKKGVLDKIYKELRSVRDE